MAQNFAFDGESLITDAQFRAGNGSLAMENPGELVVAKAELALLLDTALQQFQGGLDPSAIIGRLTRDLHSLRRRSHVDVWNEITLIAQSHHVADFLHQDPLTRWSFDKPRGYSGDAHLLDFIYGTGDTSAAVAMSSDLGRAIYAYTRNATSSVAVRERRDILAERVDSISKTSPAPIDVLSIASGHLREAAKSKALNEGGVRRWVAFDQDPISVGTVARDYRGTAVEAVNGSVKSLLGNRHDLTAFDFVYAAGLYDYLPAQVGVRLTRKCLSMLKPGGSFLFANFSDETAVDGYMETFMNWPLLLRSEDDMWKIAGEGAHGVDVGTRVWFGDNRDIVYCEITKRD